MSMLLLETIGNVHTFVYMFYFQRDIRFHVRIHCWPEYSFFLDRV